MRSNSPPIKEPRSRLATEKVRMETASDKAPLSSLIRAGVISSFCGGGMKKEILKG